LETFRVTGLRPQAPGTGQQVRDPAPGPAPEPEHPDQIPDGRDLRPESRSAPSQSSGLRFPLEFILTANRFPLKSVPVIRHLPSIPSSFISGPRWQPQVAGCGIDPFGPPRSPQFSPPWSYLSSVICPRFRHPSFQVPGDSPRGISLSGVGNQPSAAGPRLLRPPAEIS
jgi:hypothetical protein